MSSPCRLCDTPASLDLAGRYLGHPATPGGTYTCAASIHTPSAAAVIRETAQRLHSGCACASWRLHATEALAELETR